MRHGSPPTQFFDGASPFTPAFAGVDGARVLAPPITSSTRCRVGRLAVHLLTAAADMRLAPHFVRRPGAAGGNTDHPPWRRSAERHYFVADDYGLTRPV